MNKMNTYLIFIILPFIIYINLFKTKCMPVFTHLFVLYTYNNIQKAEPFIIYI